MLNWSTLGLTMECNDTLSERLVCLNLNRLLILDNNLGLRLNNIDCWPNNLNWLLYDDILRLLNKIQLRLLLNVDGLRRVNLRINNSILDETFSDLRSLGW